MESIPKSSLLGRRLHFMGFGVSPNPLGPGWVQTSVYQFSQGLVICLSQGTQKFDWESAVQGLGAEAWGDEIFPYAQRLVGVKNPTDDFMAEFKKALEESIAQSKWEWYSGRPKFDSQSRKGHPGRRKGRKDY